MRTSTTTGVFWGILFACATVTILGLALHAVRAQQQEDQGVEGVCRKMEATGGGSFADCMKQMKKMGY